MHLIYLLLGLLALGIVINLGQLMWPAWAFLLPLLFVRSFFKQSKNALLSKTLSELLLPPTIAFGVLTVVLLLVNLWQPEDALAELTAIENGIIGLDGWFGSPWMSGEVFLIVLVGYGVVAYLLRNADLVGRAIKTKMWLSRVSLTVACLTAFTFLTKEVVVLPRTDGVRLRITALYRSAKERESIALGRAVAVRIIQQALQTDGQAVTRGLLTTATIGGATADVGAYLGASDASIIAKRASLNMLTPTNIEMPSLGQMTLVDDARTLRGAREVVGSAERNADNVLRTLKQLFGESLGVATDAVDNVLWSYIENFVGNLGRELAPTLRAVGKDIFTATAGPRVEETVDRLARSFGERVSAPRGMSDAVVRARAQEYAAEAMTQVVQTATKNADDAARAAQAAIESGDDAVVDGLVIRATSSGDDAANAYRLASSMKLPGFASPLVIGETEVALAAGAVSLRATPAVQAVRRAQAAAAAAHAARAAKDLRAVRALPFIP